MQEEYTNDKKLCDWLRANSSGIYRLTGFAADKIEWLKEELETLRTKNAKLIAERDELNTKSENWNYYQNLLKMNGFSGITDLLTKYRGIERERDALLAEREAMMKQEPIARGYKNSMTGTCSDLYWLGDAPEGVTYLYASPLPAQQIPKGDV